MTTPASGPETYANVSVTLVPNTYDLIYERMVNQGTHSQDMYGRGGLLSFTDQIAQTTRYSDPDCYLFTANSAIPVADAVRGYYDVIGRQCPKLGYIMVKSSLYYEQPDEQIKKIHAETERLRPFVDGMSRVSVVEQFVNRGGTIKMAKTILYRLGIQTDAFQGSNWYHEALIDDIDLNNVTSVHANFMREVGQHAGQKVLSGDYNKRSTGPKFAAVKS